MLRVSLHQQLDPIAAIATAPGRGAVGIVRVSGHGLGKLMVALCGRNLPPRQACYGPFSDAEGQAIDQGLALWFPAPQSYTGEDVLELQMHGSPPLLQRMLARCYRLGARPARPGEFTERAFLNHKLDLAQAEAVADLIAAGSDAAARAARRSLDGVFSRRVQTLLEALTRLRVHVEAAIDFPEEEIDFLADAALTQRYAQVRSEHAALLLEAERGQRLRDGLHVVIVGPPNAGKSSLLNALTGGERAIVTDVAGTTRDLLRESVRMDGVELTLVDTAGLRESTEATPADGLQIDAIEREGMRRALAELARADLLLAVVDARDPMPQRAALATALHDAPAVLWLHNKSDLLTAPLPPDSADTLWLSARSGAGLDGLRQRLRRAAGQESGVAQANDGAFSARARQVEALRRAGLRLRSAGQQLQLGTGELAAEELRLAQDALGEITGKLPSDELLGAIFASFCIGK